MISAYKEVYKNALQALKSDTDNFLYDVIFVDNSLDALAEILTKTTIQSVVLVHGFQDNPLTECRRANFLTPFISSLKGFETLKTAPFLSTCQLIRQLRPELDLFYISDIPPQLVEKECFEQFNRVIFHVNPFQDLHYHILNGIQNRYETPFFHALQAYSKKPKTVFHALPLSQGHSVQNSAWLQDMIDFYGPTLFNAETSSTQGGLDSLLDPKGAIKQAHDKAAVTFGFHKTFFVTNGTSTANKIIMQANLCPNDIVLLSSDSHKSIPYGVMFCGAIPVFLDNQSLGDFDLYSGATLPHIIAKLTELKDKNLLHRVKLISLTNSTFDGLMYNVQAYMEAILAIKPDIIFHWDEAWFAFSQFHPIYQGFNAMTAISLLKSKYPDLNIKAYVTQSTHKTLTSFRQGSMIHIYDESFNQSRFLEAFRMHTTTSPNYQIIASLDLGRRQASLEGFERVQHMLFLSDQLRKRVRSSETLRPFFKVLEQEDFVPEQSYAIHQDQDILPQWKTAWAKHNWVMDPTRVTLDIRGSGMDGSSFRELLINRYDIQVNKTSQFTVLFIVNIGSTTDSINYLVDVLHDIATRIKPQHTQQVTKPFVFLTMKRRYHPTFQPIPVSQAVSLREAYYFAQNDTDVEFVPIDQELIANSHTDSYRISAAFVTPYPPGFPILVPGQIITTDILIYLQQLKQKEIHGYVPQQGLCVFKTSSLVSIEKTIHETSTV